MGMVFIKVTQIADKYDNKLNLMSLISIVAESFILDHQIIPKVAANIAITKLHKGSDSFMKSVKRYIIMLVLLNEACFAKDEKIELIGGQ
jgi:hypothetical protein